jgi:hypothetical protein
MTCPGIQPTIGIGGSIPRDIERSVEKLARVNSSVGHKFNWRYRIETGQQLKEFGDLTRGRQVRLRNDPTIGYRALPRDDRQFGEISRSIDPVDRRNQCVEPQSAAKAKISDELSECRSRIGKTRGLDKDAPRRSRTSGQPPNRRAKIAASGAAEASISQQQNVIRADGLREDCVVDADRAKLVHNDRDVVHAGLLEQRGNQRCLPAAEKSRDDRKWNAVGNGKTSSA